MKNIIRLATKQSRKIHSVLDSEVRTLEQEILEIPQIKPYVVGSDGKYTNSYIVGDSANNYAPVDYAALPSYGLDMTQNWYYARFFGYQVLSNLMLHPILSNYCKVFSEDVVREFIRFTSQGEEDRSEKIGQLEESFKEHKIRELIRETVHSALGLGGCAIYIRTTDGEELDESGKYVRETPLVIKGNTELVNLFDGFQIVKSNWISPFNFNATNPLEKDFYKPQHYLVMGKTVHSSRLIKIIPFEVEDTLKPTYNFFGYPMIQKAVLYVNYFDQLHSEVMKLVKRMNTNVVKTNLTDTFNDDDAGTGKANLTTRIKNFNKQADNFGALIVDKESEDFTQISMPLQHADLILGQYAELICIPLGMPATKLLGTSPKGFNATGTHDMKNYHSNVLGTCESAVRPALAKIIDVLMMVCFGEIDRGIGFEFNSLEQMNDIERADIQLKNSQRDSAYVTAGILSPQAIIKQLANDPDSPYHGLDVEAIQLQAEQGMAMRDQYSSNRLDDGANQFGIDDETKEAS